MQKWEYFIGEFDTIGMVAYRSDGKQIISIVELGERGWELCGIAGSDMASSHYLYFKRPKQ